MLAVMSQIYVNLVQTLSPQTIGEYQFVTCLSANIEHIGKTESLLQLVGYLYLCGFNGRDRLLGELRLNLYIFRCRSTSIDKFISEFISRTFNWLNLSKSRNLKTFRGNMRLS